MTLLQRTVLPVADEADAEATCAALRPYLGEVDRVVGVHVIEKAGGGIDKAPLEKRQEDAAEYLAVVEDALGGDVEVETRVAYGTDVVEALFDEAREADATAVAFVPREASRIVKLLSGDTARRLVTGAELPVVSLPEQE